MKQFILIIIAFCICHFSPANALCKDTPEKGNRTVRAGIFNFEGYHSKDKDGNLGGYGIDLLELLSEYSHLNFDLKGYEESWKNMQEMLKNGEIDLVSSARRTPEREKIYAFSLPVGRNQTILAKQLYNTSLKAGDYSTYNGMRIGAVAGSTQNKHLPEFAKDKGFTYTLIEYDSPTKLADALQAGDVDAILSSNLRKPHNETLLDIIRSDNFYIIARKEDQNLIDEINHAIEEMNLNEGDWQNDIYYRHYGPDASRIPEFSQRENAFIDSLNSMGKTVTAMARGNVPPYSYIEDGELKGILPDYFSKTMDLAGVPYKLIAPKTPEEYRKLTENNQVDVVLDKTSPNVTDENAQYTGFTTDPYLVTGLARVTRVDFNGPDRVVALSSSTPVNLDPDLIRHATVKQYPTASEALTAVKQGEADAAYILPHTAQMYMNRDPSNGLFYTMLDANGANFRMYVPATASHELITLLKKTMKRLPAGTLSQIGSSYVSVDAGEMSLTHYLHARPEIMLTGALIIMLGTSLFFFMWLRGRWNRRLLATTEHANQELAGQLAIVEALSRDYANVLSINADNGKTRTIKIADYISGEEQAKQADDNRPYEELLANYIEHRVHPKDRKFMAEALSLPNIRKQLAQKDEYTGTYRVMDKGEVRYFQFTFVKPHGDSAENANLVLAGLRNIDDVIRREQEQKKALSEALAQSRYASAAKTAFLNNMSHDIRTPMNAIIGFTTLATQNAENVPMVKRYLGKIMTSGNHLLSLINDVLDMSRIESGKVKIEEQLVHLPDILHDLRTIAQADVHSKQLDFQINTLNVVNESIYCDKLRLNQILLNILSNAMKYTHPGGKVSVSVVQTSKPVDGRAAFEFRVRDTGIGMSPKFLEHVFEPFEREQTTTVSGIQGTGLGLAITKKIVDMIGGAISVESEVGKGSEFKVSFKFRVQEEKSTEQEMPDIAGKRALIVDDDINTCTSLGKMLSEMGVKPDWTTLGKEALVRTEFAIEQKDAYGLYLIDWLMADMNGLELTRRLRKIVPPEIPIIILTAYDWTDIEEEGHEAGATGFCSKPVFFSELCNVLRRTANQDKEEETQQDSPEIFAGKRILLAEDNEMNQEIAQMILENAGFELDIVENGSLAVDKMRKMPPGHYDLVLMDVQMPIMNGYEATRQIRRLDDPLRSRIPIIAMTANAFDEDRDEAISSGMNGHVPKPIDIKKLMETLELVLKNKNTLK